MAQGIATSHASGGIHMCACQESSGLAECAERLNLSEATFSVFSPVISASDAEGTCSDDDDDEYVADFCFTPRANKILQPLKRG